jgi:hypothetical protein
MNVMLNAAIRQRYQKWASGERPAMLGSLQSGRCEIAGFSAKNLVP